MKEWKECSTGFLGTLERKRFHVKQSIDNDLNMLKAHSNPDPHSHTLADSRRQPPPSPSANIHSMPQRQFQCRLHLKRRPSLPHIYSDLSLPSHSLPISRRPRSAASPPQAVPLTHKLGSYSLLNLFREAEYACYAMTAAATGASSPELPYHNSSSIACTPPSASASPVPITIPLPFNTLASIEPRPFVAASWASASAEDGE